jgi:hypothetical protein
MLSCNWILQINCSIIEYDYCLLISPHFFSLLLWWVVVHCDIYTGSYSVSNIPWIYLLNRSPSSLPPLEYFQQLSFVHDDAHLKHKTCAICNMLCYILITESSAWYLTQGKYADESVCCYSVQNFCINDLCISIPSFYILFQWTICCLPVSQSTDYHNDFISLMQSFCFFTFVHLENYGDCFCLNFI